MVTLKTTLVSQEKTPGTESVNMSSLFFMCHLPCILVYSLSFY